MTDLIQRLQIAQELAEDYGYLGDADLFKDTIAALYTREMFPYQKTYDAIAAATRIVEGSILISVIEFREQFGNSGGPPKILGWMWERRHSNGSSTRMFCATRAEALELAKDGDALRNPDLVYPFYAPEPDRMS